MALDVARTSSAIPQQFQTTDETARQGRGVHTEQTEAEARQQAMRSAVSNLQAHYGEKPKAPREIKKTLDKDDFMKIMLSEMKHQDPTKPVDADKMATQMAQLTTVEQIKNMGAAIDRMSDRNQASDRLAMSAMIGKSVTVDKGRFTHQKGTISPLNFDLPADAEKITLSVLNEKGEEVAKHPLEPMKAGPNVYSWDGTNASNMQVPSGSYLIRVDAEDKKGAKMTVNSVTKDTIVGISFEGGEANFLVGDVKSPQKVSFKSVTKIEGDARRPLNAEVAKATGEEKASDSLPPGLPEGLKDRLKSELQARSAAAVAAAPADEAPVKAEGFPNGLGAE